MTFPSNQQHMFSENHVFNAFPLLFTFNFFETYDDYICFSSLVKVVFVRMDDSVTSNCGIAEK